MSSKGLEKRRSGRRGRVVADKGGWRGVISNVCTDPYNWEQSSDLALHVCRHQVVLIPHDVQGGDGRLLVEAAGLPAVIPATSLPQVDAEDFPGSASVEQHRDLDVQRDRRLACVFFLTLVLLVSKTCNKLPDLP